MKQVFIALALMLTLNAGAAGVKPQHRHHTPTELVDSTAKDGIEAYSDTTSAPAGEEDSTYTSTAYDLGHDADSDVHDLFLRLVGGTIGVGGVVIAILIILALLVCALAPFILLVLLLKYLINRHNSKVSLAEKSMETGVPIPDELKPAPTDSPGYYKRKGIMNIAVGVGLTLMFSVWGSDVLVGVGLLIACLGVGQLVIAKTTK